MSWSYILLIIVLVLVVILAYFYQRGKQSLIREKKAKYLNAIREGNKVKALEAGREYYSLIRGGRLTLYDEQAITNDLSTIK
jgi:hypothetical protein